jgi:hypothetical protein
VQVGRNRPFFPLHLLLDMLFKLTLISIDSGLPCSLSEEIAKMVNWTARLLVVSERRC